MIKNGKGGQNTFFTSYISIKTTYYFNSDNLTLHTKNLFKNQNHILNKYNTGKYPGIVFRLKSVICFYRRFRPLAHNLPLSAVNGIQYNLSALLHRQSRY